MTRLLGVTSRWLRGEAEAGRLEPGAQRRAVAAVALVAQDAHVRPGRLQPQPHSLAATNKYLAQSNKSSTGTKATKER